MCLFICCFIFHIQYPSAEEDVVELMTTTYTTKKMHNGVCRHFHACKRFGTHLGIYEYCRIFKRKRKNSTGRTMGCTSLSFLILYVGIIACLATNLDGRKFFRNTMNEAHPPDHDVYEIPRRRLLTTNIVNPNVVFESTSYTLIEGSNSTINITLKQPPVGSIKVQIINTHQNLFEFSPSDHVSFSSSDYNTHMTIQIHALQNSQISCSNA